MPAITAIVNPAVPDEKSILLFYNTKSAQLGLSLRSGDKSKDDKVVYAAGEGDHEGFILNPSELGADTYRGVNVVVAVTKPRLEANSEQTVNNISMVSPVYQLLTATSLSNTKVDVISNHDGDQAWVYYLDGTNAQDTTLKEYDFETGGTSTYLRSQAILVDSSLGAYFDRSSGKRYIIFQEGVQGHLMEYSPNDNQSWNIGNTNDARDNTTLSVAYVDGKVYLYYTDSKLNLRRIVKEGDKWQKPDYIEGSPKAHATTQLTVAPANGLTHIFYVSQEDKPGSFTHLRDRM